MRSSAKNMCSVRQRPMPSAPNARAALASRGMSALARTPKLPRNSSAHLHELREDGRVRIGIDGVGLAEIDFAGGAVERDPVAFLERDRLAADVDDSRSLLVLVDARSRRSRRRRECPCRARPPPRGWLLPPTRGQNALGDFHAVDVVRRGFLADQDDRTLRRHARPRLPR